MISCQRRPLQTAPVFVFVRLNHRTTSCLKFWPWTQNQLFNFKNNYQFNCVLFVFFRLFCYCTEMIIPIFYCIKFWGNVVKYLLSLLDEYFNPGNSVLYLQLIGFYKQLVIFLNCLLLFLFIYLFFKCTHWKDASAILWGFCVIPRETVTMFIVAWDQAHSVGFSRTRLSGEVVIFEPASEGRWFAHA